jgi:hypothetical protein
LLLAGAGGKSWRQATKKAKATGQQGAGPEPASA